MSCRDQFNTHIWDTDRVTDRRYPVVDEERGIVIAFGMYHQYIKGPCANVVDYGTVCPPTTAEPYTLAMAEAFKVRAGKIEEVESIFTPLPAGTSARMNAAFIRIGLSACDIGVSYFLPRLVGVSVASELMMTGRFINADRALRVGLVSEVVADSHMCRS